MVRFADRESIHVDLTISFFLSHQFSAWTWRTARCKG
jgi:hypothetical protein